MSWQPPPRPDWVAAINANEILPITAVARLPLERDALMAEACARLGLADGGFADYGHPRFPVDEMLEALDRALAAIEGEAELNTMGRFMTRRFLLRLLEVRLQLMAYLRADPGVLDEAIEAPIFVAGAPRTGTTLLHALLAVDPARRAPLGWELLRPVPPPDPDPARRAHDPRIELTERELTLPQTVVSGLLAIHVYGASRPKECLSAMSFSFRTEELTARFHVPSFERWLFHEADPRPAYAMHRLVLQVLQRRTGRTRWTLKSPVHLHALPTLEATYPDARVVLTHRDPATMLASLTSLVAHIRWAHSDRVDAIGLAREHVARYEASLERVRRDELSAAASTAPRAHRHHLRYADLVEAPFERVAELYAACGQAFSPAFEQALRAEIARRTRHEHGDHAYDLAALELEREDLRARFGAYCAHFGVPEEL
ncbi:MAG: sulfotransferase [Myxococcota bacterium]